MRPSRIQILLLVGDDFVSIPLEDYAQRTIRHLLGTKAEYLLRIGRGLFATGDRTLRYAMKRDPKHACAFHEILNWACVEWSPAMMVLRLVDFCKALETIALVQETFPGTEVIRWGKPK